MNIDRVVGHEYFHNWTGNRVTCRDWFQLTLKEGLTVFREQEFTADVLDPDTARIADVRALRAYQFPEDASPMAHPIRPASYVAIDNFYTPTIYDKGAEVVRMIQTLIGREAFGAGLTEYLRRHDGQAVTCEDFVAAMSEVSGFDFTPFMHWYDQAGTPRVTVSRDHRRRQRTPLAGGLLCRRRATPRPAGDARRGPDRRMPDLARRGQPDPGDHRGGGPRRPAPGLDRLQPGARRAAASRLVGDLRATRPPRVLPL